MIYALPQFIVFLLYLTALIVAHAAGAWVGHRNQLNKERTSSTMWIEGTLLSLLIGFTFNTAFDKYTSRNRIFSDEINSIATTKSLARVFPAPARDSLQQKIHAYILARVAYFEAGDNEVLIQQEIQHAGEIWQSLLLQAGQLASQPNNIVVGREFLASTIQMSDLAATREMLRKARVPLPVMKLLLLISLLVAFLNGTNSTYKKADWFKGIGYALLIALTLYLILDLDTTRQGYITLTNHEENLRALAK